MNKLRLVKGSVNQYTYIFQCFGTSHRVSSQARQKNSTSTGAEGASPHSLLQHLLNQSSHDEYVGIFEQWSSPTYSSESSLVDATKHYVEFDLQQIFDGGLYSDFRLLLVVLSSFRVEGCQKNVPLNNGFKLPKKKRFKLWTIF